MSSRAERKARAFALIAELFALLAEDAETHAPAGEGAPPEWLPVAASPLGKRRTLALARAGAIESSKCGRAVLVRASSLASYLEEHRRDGGANDAGDDEDLFGSRAAS